MFKMRPDARYQVDVAGFGVVQREARENPEYPQVALQSKKSKGSPRNSAGRRRTWKGSVTLRWQRSVGSSPGAHPPEAKRDRMQDDKDTAS